MTRPIPNDPRVGATHNRALCCECGTLRTYSQRAGLRNHLAQAYTPEEIAEHKPKRPHLWVGVQAWERQLADFKCATCKRITRHALMRDTCPEWRDRDELDPRAGFASEAQAADAVDASAARNLRREMRRLEGFGVRFEWRQYGADTQPTTIGVEQTLFDLSWRITLNECMPAKILVDALANVWPYITDRTRCEQIGWKVNKNARYTEFTYLDPWISEYVDSVAADIVPRAMAWARPRGDLA